MHFVYENNIAYLLNNDYLKKREWNSHFFYGLTDKGIHAISDLKKYGLYAQYLKAEKNKRQDRIKFYVPFVLGGIAIAAFIKSFFPPDNTSGIKLEQTEATKRIDTISIHLDSSRMNLIHLEQKVNQLDLKVDSLNKLKGDSSQKPPPKK